MSGSVIPYERQLPFNPDRNPYKQPTSYLVKDRQTYAVTQGRRPSKMLLVDKLRTAVGEWRSKGYEGASETTKDLFAYWFEEDHLVDGNPFQFYFCQREAIETIVYLKEVEGFSDLIPVVKKYSTLSQGTLFTEDLLFETPDGKRSIRRYFPELKSESTQDLPERNLLRFATKMATGSGKTVVMALAMVWSYFNRTLEKRDDLADNFLLIAPNVIVLERLEKDFLDGVIFKRLPMIPPFMKGQWNFKVITRGDTSLPHPSGNLFLQNIQQLYESRDVDSWTPENAIQALLGKPARKELERSALSVLHHVKKLRNLMVLNDEAHHVHDEDLAWHKTLLSLHHSVPGGLKLWLDFSATPKNQNGTYFPWIVSDYPLAEAVEDAIVKAPIILHTVKRKDPENVTQENVTRVYFPWIAAALERWRYHVDYYAKFGKKPVLFIMAEKNILADKIAELVRRQSGIEPEEVLVIHTDNEGEVKKSEIEGLRIKAREIDEPDNKIKIVVSVLMLREGWDVQNVTITLGLRPFTAKAGILPEQAIGRGLRIITGIGLDTRQTLEVVGTDAFEEFVRELEQEGVGVSTFTEPPPLPIHIEPVNAKMDCDIEIPQTDLIYSHNYKQLSTIDPLSFPSLKESNLIAVSEKIEIEMEYATTETYLGTIRIDPSYIPTAAELLSHITNEVILRASLVGSNFSELYPIVKKYVAERSFNKPVEVDDERVRRRLVDPDVQNAIISIVARYVGQASVVISPIRLKQGGLLLSRTPIFVWRRKHIKSKRTIFNFVATYNDFESKFAEFLTGVPDIERFASLAERNVGFKIDYLSSRGAIKLYYPDFVAVQRTDEGLRNWIIETKGREWPDTDKKDAAIENWCREVSKLKKARWSYAKIPQETFEKHDYYDFAELVKAISRAEKQP